MSALFVLTSAVTPLMVFAASTPSVGSLAPEFTFGGTRCDSGRPAQDDLERFNRICVLEDGVGKG